MPPSVHDAKYAKGDGSIRWSTTHGDHLKKLFNGVDEIFADIFKHEKDSSVVEARRYHLIRSLAGRHCRSLICEISSASSAAKDAVIAGTMIKDAARIARRQHQLETAVFDGLLQTIKDLSPRGKGRLTNARKVLRRCV